MAKKMISKISDKLAKVNESFTVTMYDNGFMLEVSGRDSDEEWKNAKIIVPTSEQLVELINEAVSMPRDEYAS